MLKKFFIVNSVLVGCSVIGYQMFIDSKNQKLYKNTKAFDLAMRTLRSHEGAAFYLGERIKDGRLFVVGEDKDKDKDITTYRVKVGVKGDKTKGVMHFWLRRTGEEPDVEVTRIELHIKDFENRLLIMGENNPVESQNQGYPS